MAEVHRLAWTTSESKGAEGEKREFWTKIGRSFLNKDGSETVLLDAVPLSGRLILQDRKAKQPKEGEAEA